MGRLEPTPAFWKHLGFKKRHLSGVAALTATKPLWSNLSILRHGGLHRFTWHLEEIFSYFRSTWIPTPKEGGEVVAKIKVLVVGMGVFLIIAQYLWIGRNEFLSLEHVDDSSHLFISFAMLHVKHSGAPIGAFWELWHRLSP